MKLTKFATSAVALLAAGALVFGASTSASAAYPPNAKLSISGSSTGSAGVTKTFKVKGSVSGKYSGEKVTATIGGRTSTTTLSSKGEGSISVRFPATAGKFSIKFTAFKKSFSKSITVGKAAPITGLAAQKITSKSDKTSKISGKTADNGTVSLKIVGPSGVSTKYVSVKAGSNGKFSYNYSKASKKGTYTVTATFKDSKKFYGTSSKTVSFKKTK